MSLDVLLTQGRAAHEALMMDTVRLSVPGATTFDRDTGQDVAGPPSVLYEGKARVKPSALSTAEEKQAGEREVLLSRYEVAVPWTSTVLGGGRVPPGAVVDVVDSPDARLQGLRLWVTSVQYGATATAWRIQTEDRS